MFTLLTSMCYALSWVDNVMFIQDHGSLFDTGSAEHSLAMYKAASGSIVFAAGTVQWSWGLDGHHDVNDPPRANMYDVRVGEEPLAPDSVIQQATVNLFADMGLQVQQDGLVACTKKL